MCLQFLCGSVCGYACRCVLLLMPVNVIIPRGDDPLCADIFYPSDGKMYITDERVGEMISAVWHQAYRNMELC